MKYLLLVALLASVSVAYAQVGPAEYAIGSRDAAWLTKRGFPMDTYSWNNEVINQQLALAARYRRQSNRCWRYGGLAYLGSSLAVVGIAIGSFGVPSGQRRPYEIALIVTTTLGTGGYIMALGGGIWRKAKARRRAREALRRYQ